VVFFVFHLTYVLDLTIILTQISGFMLFVTIHCIF